MLLCEITWPLVTDYGTWRNVRASKHDQSWITYPRHMVYRNSKWLITGWRLRWVDQSGVTWKLQAIPTLFAPNRSVTLICAFPVLYRFRPPDLVLRNSAWNCALLNQISDEMASAFILPDFRDGVAKKIVRKKSCSQPWGEIPNFFFL